MHFAALGNGAIQFVQEAQKLLMSVPRGAVANHSPIQDIQSGKESARAVALVIVCLAFRNAGP